MAYQKINWQNGEAGGTPLNATNLNKMDAQIDANTTAIATNTADIAEIKRNTEFNLTSASPLNGCSASSIVGIDACGNSTQSGTPTPTNPIAIVDASGDVTCRTEDNTQSNTITLPTLRSVGDVKDELIVNADGSGQIIKRIDVFTPTAISGFGTDANNGNYFSITTPSAIIADASNAIVMCNKLIGKSYNGRHADVNVSRIYRSATNNTNLLWIQMAKGDTTCTDEASALAFAKTLTIYYQLATPTTETLTSAQVASIRQLQTYSGTTIVDSALDVKSVTYHADTKQYIDGRTDYSYSDTIIGKWADGKDLHRMVIQTTTPSTTSDTVVSTLVNQTKCDVKTINGCFSTSGGSKLPINYFGMTGYYTSCYVSTNGIQMVASASAYTSKPCEIIVEYTLKNESAISVLSDDGEYYGQIETPDDENIIGVITEG